MFGPLNLLELYQNGVFPMAQSADDQNIMIIDPEFRGIIPLDDFHIPRRLRRDFGKHNFQITVNKDFKRVMEACAQTDNKRRETWINAPIIALYCALNVMGKAHSVEVWQDENLVGGLYGVSLGSVFFGESMFSRATNTSKYALIHLVAALKFANYKLLDAQFHNPHLEQFGLIEITRDEFQERLEVALKSEAIFPENNFKPIDLQSDLSAGALQQFPETVLLQQQDQQLSENLSLPSFCLSLLR